MKPFSKKGLSLGEINILYNQPQYLEVEWKLLGTDIPVFESVSAD
jgi:hypothetical protein